MDELKRKRQPGRSARTNQAMPTQADSEQMFYETMPFALGSHYIYRDDADQDVTVPVTVAPTDDPSNAAKRVLVLSLITVTILAVLLGLGFMAGLSMLQDVIGSDTARSITT